MEGSHQGTPRGFRWLGKWSLPNYHWEALGREQKVLMIIQGSLPTWIEWKYVASSLNASCPTVSPPDTAQGTRWKDVTRHNKLRSPQWANRSTLKSQITLQKVIKKYPYHDQAGLYQDWGYIFFGGCIFHQFHIYKFVHDFHQFPHPSPLQPPWIHLAHPSEAWLRLKPQRPNARQDDKIHIELVWNMSTFLSLFVCFPLKGL